MLYVAVVCFHCFKLFHGVIYHILFISTVRGHLGLFVGFYC